MWKTILQSFKARSPLIAVLFSAVISSKSFYGQQNIIANKDNTRPETARQFDAPARVSALIATKFNGYNEIQWSTALEQNTRRFTAEYSYDGINFQSAGEIMPGNGTYSLKHYTPDTRSVLYRVRMEGLNGKFYYSDNIILNGVDVQPVKIYPTAVTGNVLNANADFPVERIIVTSSDGQQMFAKDLNGASELIRVNIPTLNKGLYFITFYGNGWKSTAKFIVS